MLTQDVLGNKILAFCYGGGGRGDNGEDDFCPPKTFKKQQKEQPKQLAYCFKAQ